MTTAVACQRRRWHWLHDNDVGSTTMVAAPR
jgi:hypothetical protein